MKILIFYTDFIEANRLANQMVKMPVQPAHQCELALNQEEFQEKFNNLGPELVILDREGNKKTVEAFNKIIGEKFPQIIRFMVSSDTEGIEIEMKKHQKTQYRAHGYFIRPLKAEFLQLILNDLTKVAKS